MSWSRGVVVAVFLGVLVLVGWAGSGFVAVRDEGGAGRAGRTAGGSAAGTGTPEASRAPDASRAEEAARAEEEAAAEAGRRLARAMAGVRVGGGARFSVAVVPVDDDGAPVAYRGASVFVTASVVKVDVLAALLLGAQDKGRRLTGREREHAAAMIGHSDNASTTTLWEALGGAPGLDAANARLGLTGTTAGAGGLWGLTRTTAVDRIALLRAVFAAGADPELNEDSRGYARELMAGVVAGQDWGVSAAGDGERRAALKNGWLPRSATGLWVINSTGCVSVDGRRYLLAVLSDGHTSMHEGISLVERVSRRAVGAVAGR
ncbi:serine hydrolase [Streptomyces uncialis]|uniref:serine hydrolase n=1 Tax=Streptomyces uncialis TaxID=1048205 RepID=UPI0033FD401C